MKSRPDSEHFWANVAFSLSYEQSGIELEERLQITYKAIPRMYSSTAILFGGSNYFVAIQIRRSIAQVDRMRRAQSML